MSISYDNFTSSGFHNPGTQTFNHTVGSGNDRLLVVGTMTLLSGGSVTAVSYNGVSMTQVHNVDLQGGSAEMQTWYLLNPASGTNVVSITGGGETCALAVSYVGVLQSGQPDAHNGNSDLGSGTSVSTTITTVTVNSWIITFGAITSDTTCTAGSGFTLRGNGNASGNSMQIGIEDSNGGINPAGATTTAMSFGASSHVGIATLSFKPNPNSSVTMGQGSFTFTGKTVGLLKGSRIAMVVGNFVLTGISILFHKTNGWKNLNKSSTPTYTDTTKHGISLSNQTKHNSTFTPQSKN